MPMADALTWFDTLNNRAWASAAEAPDSATKHAIVLTQTIALK